MAHVDFTLQRLHDEIEADPEALGYKNPDTTWKDDQVIAGLINAKNYKIDRHSVPMEEVRYIVSYEAYNTLAIDEQEWLRWMTPNGGNFRVSADMKLQLTGRSLAADGIAGTGNDSLSFWSAAHRGIMCPELLALIEVDGSRAEVLWGEGRLISVGQVGAAANL